MNKKMLTGLVLLLCTSMNWAEEPPLKREFRGAWIATISRIDWPKSNGSGQQIEELGRLLDDLKRAGINTVVFQIRPECDALYESSIEPWSYHLTGAQGVAPNPWYDPLATAVQEAHLRGMELHAWFNPYRAQKSAGSYPQAANHIMKRHPEWILSKGSYRYLDPGLPQVREYVISVFMDVARRYDIDGVHFDDYFYPYEGITSEDDASFAAYSRGFTDRGDWRRDNINLFVRQLHDSLLAVKPHIKLGISPFGIRKNSDAGTRGMESYYSIYCDPLAWITAKTIDYLTPQVYWAFAREVAPYGRLVPWWASVMDGRHLYVGQGAYNMETASAFPNGQWPASEVCRQVRFNRNTANVQGQVFYSATHVQRNVKGLTDSLRNDLYAWPALHPVMAWKEQTPPLPPQQLQYVQSHPGGPAQLVWEPSWEPAGGDTAVRFALYRFKADSGEADLSDARNLVAVTGRHAAAPAPPAESGAWLFTVTALDRNANESPASNFVTISPPASPLLAGPIDAGETVGSSALLRWHDLHTAAAYEVQMASDSTFAVGLLLQDAAVADTFRLADGLTGGRDYYWRARALNPAGIGPWSATARFTSAVPALASLVYPVNNSLNVPVQVTFSWNRVSGATGYRIQVARSVNFDAGAILFDQAELADTLAAAPMLETGKIYFWRIKARNEWGEGDWSAVSRFKTTTLLAAESAAVLPEGFSLQQNYPNPFNPVTMIGFTVPQDGDVRLAVYDLRGRLVEVLAEGHRLAGAHLITFNGANLPSGVYLCRITFAGQTLSRRMMLVK